MKFEDWEPVPEYRPWTREEIVQTVLCLLAVALALGIGCFAGGAS